MRLKQERRSKIRRKYVVCFILLSPKYFTYWYRAISYQSVKIRIIIETFFFFSRGDTPNTPQNQRTNRGYVRTIYTLVRIAIIERSQALVSTNSWTIVQHKQRNPPPCQPATRSTDVRTGANTWNRGNKGDDSVRCCMASVRNATRILLPAGSFFFSWRETSFSGSFLRSASCPASVRAMVFLPYSSIPHRSSKPALTVTLLRGRDHWHIYRYRQ